MAVSNTFTQQIHLHGDILEDYVVIFKELVKKLKVGKTLPMLPYKKTHRFEFFLQWKTLPLIIT